MILNCAVFLAWILTGCGGDGIGPDQLNDQGVHDIPKRIQTGKTTKIEIIKLFEHPAKMTFIGDGQEV